MHVGRALIFCVATLFAQTATATRNVNLRSDPSGEYPPIRLLAPSESPLTLIDPMPGSGYDHVKTAAGEGGYVWGRGQHVYTPSRCSRSRTASRSLASSLMRRQVSRTLRRTVFGMKAMATPMDGSPGQNKLRTRVYGRPGRVLVAARLPSLRSPAPKVYRPVTNFLQGAIFSSVQCSNASNS
jgi:hypothetical protein